MSLWLRGPAPAAPAPCSWALSLMWDWREYSHTLHLRSEVVQEVVLPEEKQTLPLNMKRVHFAQVRFRTFLCFFFSKIPASNSSCWQDLTVWVQPDSSRCISEPPLFSKNYWKHIKGAGWVHHNEQGRCIYRFTSVFSPIMKKIIPLMQWCGSL